jgi:tetratricopeptide (TPR) repeat protein
MIDKDLLEREEMLEDILDALEDGDFDEVEDMADEAIEVFPEDAFGYFYMGEALFLQYDYTEAAYYFQHAVSKALNNSAYIARLALVNAKLEEEEKAKILYKKVLQINPEHVDSMVALAVYALNDTHYETAGLWLDKAINLAPDNTEAYKIRSFLLETQGQYQLALNDLEFLMQRLGPDNSLYQQKLSILSYLNDDALIAALYQDWILHIPDNKSIYFKLASFEMERQSYVAAETALDCYIAAAKYGDFEIRDAYLMRAWAYYHQDKSTLAKDGFKKALDLNPKTTDAYVGLCNLMLAADQMDAAMSYLDIGINLLAEEAWPLSIKKVHLLIDSKLYDQANAILKGLNTHKDEEVQGLSYFLLGNLHQLKGDLFAAYQAWQAASDLYHSESDERIEMYCQEFVEQSLKAKESALLLDMQADFQENADSIVLQHFFGCFWAADVQLTASNNEMFAQIPSKMEKQILDLLSNICVAIQPQGILVLNPGYDAVRMLYQMVESSPNKTTITGIPLHAATEKEFEITWDGTNMLLKGFGDKDADIQLYLTPLKNKNQLPQKAQDDLNVYATAGELEYMGKAFNQSI